MGHMVTDPGEVPAAVAVWRERHGGRATRTALQLSGVHGDAIGDAVRAGLVVEHYAQPNYWYTPAGATALADHDRGSE
jgi:hypothetical protein